MHKSTLQWFTTKIQAASVFLHVIIPVLPALFPALFPHCAFKWNHTNTTFFTLKFTWNLYACFLYTYMLKDIFVVNRRLLSVF